MSQCGKNLSVTVYPEAKNLYSTSCTLESLTDPKGIDFITTRLLFILGECVGLGEKTNKKPTQTKNTHKQTTHPSYKQTPQVFHDCLKTLQKKYKYIFTSTFEKGFLLSWLRA